MARRVANAHYNLTRLAQMSCEDAAATHFTKRQRTNGAAATTTGPEALGDEDIGGDVSDYSDDAGDPGVRPPEDRAPAGALPTGGQQPAGAPDQTTGAQPTAGDDEYDDQSDADEPPDITEAEIAELMAEIEDAWEVGDADNDDQASPFNVRMHVEPLS